MSDQEQDATVDTSTAAVSDLRPTVEAMRHRDYGTTHWNGCHVSHPRCLVYRLWDMLSAVMYDRDAKDAEIATLRAQLAEAQAREAKLREALNDVLTVT